MRGSDERTEAMYSYVSPEARIPEDHPLRGIRTIVNRVLLHLSPVFERMYAKVGRPSIPPEQLLRALLIQILYSVRSERMLMEQLEYNLLFRWFVGLSMDETVWVPSVFSKNRDRLLKGDIARELLACVIEEAQRSGLMSEEHFTVDGTLLKAWASHKSVKPKDDDEKPSGGESARNTTVDFHGEKRTNETHRSTTDPEAKLFRKGKNRPADLCYMGHVLMENRNGLVSDAEATQASGTAEREAAIRMVGRVPGGHPITVGADKGYDTKGTVQELRDLTATPHVAQNTTRRRSAIDGRTTRHPGYRTSQIKRKRVEEIFGWMKTIGLLRQLRHRGREAIDWIFKLTAVAYNLTRMRNLELAA